MTRERVRTRFAPSPTGSLHLGSLRTALFAWMWAKHAGGDFLLRIEDTDSKRFDPSSVGGIMSGLRWLGLEWDEGPDIGGPCGPYTQSERGAIYREHADRLLESGKAYRCFCSPERLRLLREEQKAAGLQTKYDGACREMPVSESDRRAESEPFTVRLKMPTEGFEMFRDLLRGEIKVSAQSLQDPILLKSDGMAVYHLAAVVDDHSMRISHVLRGEEWIATAPYHASIYRAFGWPMPVMVHLPVILNPDGKGKMSKRRTAQQSMPVHVRDFQEEGYLPEAMFNFLALLGWTPDASSELFTRGELIEKFELSQISSSAAKMPYEKLAWMNGEYLKEMDLPDFREAAASYMARHFDRSVEDVQEMRGLDYVLPEVQTRVKTLGEVAPWVDWAFKSAGDIAYEPVEPLIGRKLDAAESCRVLEEASVLTAAADSFRPEILQDLFKSLPEKLGLKLGSILGPVRGALTGTKVSPPLFEMMAALGREECLLRLKRARARLAEETVGD